MKRAEPNTVRILLVDDDEDEAVLARTRLAKAADMRCEIRWEPDFDAALAALRQGGFDICLLDFRLGARTGLEFLEACHDFPDRPPVILLTGQGDADTDIRAMRAGAADYLDKTALSAALLERSVRYALQRHADQVALEESRGLTRALLNAPGDMVFLMDCDGRILEANDALPVRFGLTKQEVLGHDAFELLPDDVADRRRAEMRQVIETGEPAHFVDRRAGRYVDNRFFPIKDDGGRVDRIAVFARDVTEQKITELALESSNTELQQFAYAVSHDLQEPLRMITSYVQLIEKRYAATLGDEGREFMGFVTEAAARMRAMIQDLLEFSRVQTRGETLHPFDSAHAFEAALTNLRFAIEDSGGRVDHGPLPNVVGDEGQLTRLFQNLVGNALKYGAPDRPPEVRVEAAREGDDWHFTVADNGIGIEPRYFERIFGIFQRLHGRGAYEGTGIGLALCKRIADRHHGRIWVDSEPGKGSVFHFTLPAVDVRRSGEETVNADA